MAELPSDVASRTEAVSLQFVGERTNLVIRLAMLVNMVAHFICVLFSGFVIYTAKPGSSKWYILWILVVERDL